MRRGGLLGAAILLTAVVGMAQPMTATAKPAAPTILNVIRGNGSITVNLAPPGGVLDPALKYQARCIAGSTVTTSSPSASPTVVVSGLTNGTTWRCEGRVRDASGWSTWSNDLPMKPSATAAMAPATPAKFKMIPGAGQVTFSVKAPDNGGATIIGYSARCKLAGRSLTIDSPTRKFTLGGFSLDRAWSCTVSATNPVGRSGSSAAKSVTVQAASLIAGGYHTCALQSGSTLKCWGYNENGQIGDGTTSDALTPQTVTGLPSVPRAMTAGAVHTCALSRDKSVWCWGANAQGQIGDGTTADRLRPTRVSGLSAVSALAAGRLHTCAVSRGKVFCWGSNSEGQLGDGTTDNRSIPGEVPGLSDVKAVALGDTHTCALTTSGGVTCWGGNGKGQLGDGTTVNSPRPRTVTGLSDVQSLQVGFLHSCALRTNGSVSCWGSNPAGELGDGTTDDRLVPTPVPGLGNATSIAIGGFHSCAVLSNNTVTCWGGNNYGQLGDGTTDYRTAPTSITGLTGVVSATAGYYHTCALASGGTVFCWGQNAVGALGDGTRADRNSPGAVSGTS